MWPHGQQDLRTAKIFRDLMQFYGSIDQSIYSEDDGRNLPQSNASFMPAISQRTLVQNSVDQQVNSNSILNRDLLGNTNSTRKNSHVTRNGMNNVASFNRGIQGSGATLNDPYMKRTGKNMVTIKPGLEPTVSGNMVGNTQTDIEGHGRGGTPEHERDSIVHTPPRNENTLTPIGSSAKK